MVSITLSVPAEVKQKMDSFPEMNWSGFVRQSITKKAEELDWRQKMLEKLKNEAPIDDWAVKTLQKSREGRFEELKRKGLV